MTTTTAPRSAATLDPESIGRYVQGPPPEMSQYAFFIGDWDCELRAHPPGGGKPLAFAATWTARWVHDGRMLLDDLTVFLPDGREALGWLNLRTWSPEEGCWHISSQRALAPSSGIVTRGFFRGGEMQLEFEADGDAGPLENLVRFHGITEKSFEWEWSSRVAGTEPFRPFASLSARRSPTQEAAPL